MKSNALLIMALLTIMLCGCTKKGETEVTETTTETSVSTFNEYILTRGWDGDELLASIFYCGEYHPLPMNIEDYPDFYLSDRNLYFPDASSAAVTTNEHGEITGLQFSAASAPYDLSVYGIDFNARITDIQDKLGFANDVHGEKENIITITYEGGGITRLQFTFEKEKLVTIYISA